MSHQCLLLLPHMSYARRQLLTQRKAPLSARHRCEPLHRRRAQRNIVKCVCQIFIYSSSYLVLADRILPFLLKASQDFPDLIVHKRLHPLDRDYEIIAQMIHVPDVLSGKIPSVQDKTGILIPIRYGLVQHQLKLRDIDDTARIGLVEQRLPVVAIVRYGIVEDRKHPVFLGMSEFNDLDITGLAVLIGRIIGNIDLILLFPVPRSSL